LETSARQHTSPSICRQMVTVTTSYPARPGRQPVLRALLLRSLDSATSVGRGHQRRKSGQGERTGTFFECIWLGTLVDVHSHWMCITAQASSRCAPTNNFCIRTPHFAWVCAQFPTSSKYKIPHGSMKLQKVLVVKQTQAKTLGALWYATKVLFLWKTQHDVQ